MVFPGIDENRLKRVFIDEVEEMLEKLNHCLLELERRPEDPALVKEAFRLTHSVKSEASTMRYPQLAGVAHRLEDVFERVRDGNIALTRPLMDGIFSGADVLTELLGRITRGGGDGDFDPRGLFADLDRLLDPPSARPPAGGAAVAESEPALAPFELAQIREAADRGERLYRLVFRVAEDEPMKYPRAYLVFNNLEQLTNVIRTTPDMAAGDAEDRQFGRVTALLATRLGEQELARAVQVDQVEGVEWSALDPAALLSGREEGPPGARGAPPAPASAAGGGSAPAPADQAPVTDPSPATYPAAVPEAADEEPARARLEKTSIRVETRKLNDLWQLIGELIISRSRFNRLLGQLQGADEGSRKGLEAIADVLERISAGMQQAMMETRMVPISVIYSKLSRRVRDLAVGLGKEADLELRGADTEIDRGVVEVLSAPLTHLINNSLDHGLEKPEERERLGKPRRGRVSISARQEGGRVLIEVADDGRGLDLEAIRRKAEAPAGISDEEAMRLIFRPGLSTKERVTELAGRGVGMDVVDSTIRLELGGQVLVHSEAGRGTCFSIILPLALNILNTLIVTCRGQPFAIPVQSIGETVKAAPEEVLAGDGTRRLLYRQGTVPLLELETLLGLPAAPPQERYGVILQGRGREVCLLVDQLVEEQELVIKPVDALLNERHLFSGVSVLGDGRVVFILDTSFIEEIGLEPGRLHGDPDSAGR